MAFHFCSHSWEVRDVEDGTLVRLTNRDLNQETIPVLVDDLIELVRESGQPNLYLDFSDIHLVSSVVLGKLVSLDAKLHEHGGRLTLTHIDSFLYQTFQATRLDIRRDEVATALA